MGGSQLETLQLAEDRGVAMRIQLIISLTAISIAHAFDCTGNSGINNFTDVNNPCGTSYFQCDGTTLTTHNCPSGEAMDISTLHGTECRDILTMAHCLTYENCESTSLPHHKTTDSCFVGITTYGAQSFTRADLSDNQVCQLRGYQATFKDFAEFKAVWTALADGTFYVALFQDTPASDVGNDWYWEEPDGTRVLLDGPSWPIPTGEKFWSNINDRDGNENGQEQHAGLNAKPSKGMMDFESGSKRYVLCEYTPQVECNDFFKDAGKKPTNPMKGSLNEGRNLGSSAVAKNCGALCLRVAVCYSFGFNPTTGDCILSQSHPSRQASDFTPDANYDLYFY